MEHEPRRGNYIFQTYADVARDIAEWEPSLPGNILAVAGVPRGGIHVAAMLAQRRNIPVLSVDELVGGSKPWLSPLRRQFGRVRHHENGFVLVVDDTVCRGGTMRDIKSQLSRLDVPVQFAALYSNIHPGTSPVDFAYRQMNHHQQTFEWSLFHDYFVHQQAFDLDGVLCEDWCRRDDGPELENYERHLIHAKCLNRPTRKLGLIATARVEKYRPQTVEWLKRNGIEYERLAMMPYDSNAERFASTGGDHDTFAARWKADQAKGALLFVESGERQASIIAQSGMSVLSWPGLTKHNIEKLSTF